MARCAPIDVRRVFTILQCMCLVSGHCTPLLTFAPSSCWLIGRQVVMLGEVGMACVISRSDWWSRAGITQLTDVM